MQTVLYIALGVLVAAVVAMQIWMLRAGSSMLPASRRGLAVFLRLFNIVLVVGAVGLVAYALWKR